MRYAPCVISKKSGCDILEIGVKAEWDKATNVLVSNPGLEMFQGVIHSEASKFLQPFDTGKAQSEHSKFRDMLAASGIEVLTVQNLLLSDEQKLKFLAANSLSYIYVNSNGSNKISDLEEAVAVSSLKTQTLGCISVQDLLRIVFEQPRIFLRYLDNQTNSFVFDHYESYALMNHYFQRDQQIVTDKGIVIGKMFESVRKNEVALAKTVFAILGIKPLYAVNGDGTLEGGDYMPAGNFALIGRGLRTNIEGINQLLASKALGFPEVAVVHDNYMQMDEMHLDTYFNMVSPEKALLVADRMMSNHGKANPAKIPMVDVYKIDDAGYYQRQTTDATKIPLQNYIESKRIEIIPIPKQWQLDFGINVLTISEDNIIAVENVDKDYVPYLKDFGITVIETDMSNLSKGYGGPHCMTQVLRRAS